VDIGLAVLEPGTTRKHAYVALTRGRSSSRAWVPDPSGSLDPADALTAMITRTPDTDSALATRARLHQDAGLPIPTTDLGRGTAESPSPDPAGRDGPAAIEEASLGDRVAAMQRRLHRLGAPETGRGIRR
jgi:hypothetical protein